MALIVSIIGLATTDTISRNSCIHTLRFYRLKTLTRLVISENDLIFKVGNYLWHLKVDWYEMSKNLYKYCNLTKVDKGCSSAFVSGICGVVGAILGLVRNCKVSDARRWIKVISVITY